MKTAQKLFLLFVFLSNILFAASYTYNLQKGWNLVGIILAPSADSARELLSHPVYEFQNGGGNSVFQQSVEISAGKAYWLYWEQDGEFVLQGTPVAGGVIPGGVDFGIEGYHDLSENIATAEGSTVTRTASDIPGYRFTEWTVTGATVADKSQKTITFAMPANQVVLIPNYAVNSYTLTVDGNAEQVSYGATVTRTASDKEGHTFKDWTVEGVEVADKTANPLEFSMPACDVTLTSNYTVNSYTLTVDGNAEQVSYGATVTRTASDKEGHTFKDWTVEGVQVVDKTQKTITFAMPANEVVLTANYEKVYDYLVVTLSSGEVRYTDDAPVLSEDTCRTTQLWLKRIPAGSFTMGSPKGEVGRDGTDEVLHQVTLTKDYYVGVFEMTQGQFELITDKRPSYFRKESDYATRPVEQVSYDMICVGDDSFLGKLRTKTGLAFDLPTEAQWEYACRAETTTALNTGENLKSDEKDTAMDAAGRYNYNGGEDCEEYEVYDKGYYNDAPASAGTAKVGSYPPNAWGLYDMHGNVCEWCLDWYDEYSGDATDPVGPQSGSDRVMRGGSWDDDAGACRSAYRDFDAPAEDNENFGFRVVFVPKQL